MQQNLCSNRLTTGRMSEGANGATVPRLAERGGALGSNPLPAEGEEQVEGLVRKKVRSFGRRSRLSRSDLSELGSDLFTHVRLRLSRFDATQASLATFVDRISTRWLNSYLRHRFAAKRSPRREECSLDERVRDGSDRLVERHEIIVEASIDLQRVHDLRRDLEALRAHLPSDHHRHFLDAKSRGGTTNSIAIELGICRPRVEVIELEVREVALRIGLDGYLER